MRLIAIYRRVAPDIAYHVALKPVLLGTLAARLAGVRRRVNALGGVGFLFGDTPSLLKPMRRIVALALRLLLQRDHTILQNDADLRLLQSQAAVPPDGLHLIAGAGVDLARFSPRPESPERPVTITLVSRMLWDKGVAELVAAAELLSARGTPARVWLVGKRDPENPRSIDEAQLLEWTRRGLVRWLGHVDDIDGIWAQSHIAVLPSYYREGLPKSLMEAAACGRPIVTTDLPGCRDAIVPGLTGLLVPPRNPTALADALQRLICDDGMRRKLGEEARRDAEARFCDDAINGRILDLCDRLLERDSGT
jgi:glycosyltransferase involved in cell wall biosynthesis